MATTDKKRKRVLQSESSLPERGFSSNVTLDALSDGEEHPSDDEDDGEFEPFPELDPDSSDSEYGSEEDEEDEEEGTPGEGEDSEGEESEVEHSVFPKVKVVISKITGQPKLVYPPIEPEYDSDSSTEDVSYQIIALYS